MKAALATVLLVSLALIPPAGAATDDARCTGVAEAGGCVGIRNSDARDWQCIGSYVDQGACSGVLVFPGAGGACIGVHKRCDDGVAYAASDLRCKGVATAGTCEGIRFSEGRDWACVGSYVDGGACRGILLFHGSGCIGTRTSCPSSLLPDLGFAERDARCFGVADGGDCVGLRASDTGDWSCLGSYALHGTCAGLLLFPGAGGACVGTHRRCDDGVPGTPSDLRCKGVADGGSCTGVRTADSGDWTCVGRYADGQECAGVLAERTSGQACDGRQRTCRDVDVLGLRRVTSPVRA